MRKWTLLFIILISTLSIFLSVEPNISFAWSCDTRGPKELYNRSQSVFIGKVALVSNDSKNRVTFEVESSLKGNNGEVVTLVTTVGDFFKEGERYLVYAYKTTKERYLYRYEKGEFATDTWCGGSKELAQASDDLVQIGEAKVEAKYLRILLLYLIVPLIIFSAMISLILIVKRIHEDLLKLKGGF